MHAPMSLTTRTLLTTVASLVVFVAATAGFVYSTEKAEALARHDAHLEDMATALARAEVGVLLPRALTMDSQTFQERLESEKPFPNWRRGRHHRNMQMMPPEERRTMIPAGEKVLIRLISRQGQAVKIRLDTPLHAGLGNQTVDGEAQRVYTIFLPTGRYTSVAEPIAIREEAAKEAAVTAVMPLLVLLPLLVGVIGFVLWFSLRPLKRAAAEVAARQGDDLTPLSVKDAPAEVVPFIESVNGLLGKVNAARIREIRFTADAAHELRSPLTSMTIEADHLAKLPMSPEAQSIVDNLQSGLRRSVHQLSQLLHFARAQSGEKKESERRDSEPWYLSELTSEILEPLLPLMEEKAIDFSVEGLENEKDPVKNIAKSFIHAILRNLLENALRYTPEKGRVELTVERCDTTLILEVKDSGPGIPESERNKVFDPFYRITGTKVTGTGLGLSIVKTYADKVGAAVTLADAQRSAPHGLLARVVIPLKN